MVKSDTLSNADGNPLKVFRKVTFEVMFRNSCIETELVVANIEDKALLGLDVLMKFSLDQ